MSTTKHWTARSTDDFVYAISASFTSQIETKMEADGVSRTELAKRLNKSTGRVSQVLNDPGNLGLKLIVEYARELGMKVSIVAYDDKDPNNERGPIDPEVFVKSWEKLSRPANLFEVDKVGKTSIATNPITTDVFGTQNHYGLSYTSTPAEEKAVGVYFTTNAIALDSSSTLYFPVEPINSAPNRRKEPKAA